MAARTVATAKFECPWNVKVGANTAIGDHAIIYALGPITIGRRVSVKWPTSIPATRVMLPASPAGV